MKELHLHLDGSLSAKTMKKMSEETGVPIPQDFEKHIHYDAASGTLADYLKCFELPLSLMQGKEAVRFSVMALLEELYAEGCDYAEIRFAPQFHTGKGDSQLDIVRAAAEGLDYGDLMGIKAGLILCLMRGGSEKANEETLDAAEKMLGKGVVAIDLAGDEATYPVGLYADYFKYAKEHNIPFTIHAGEAAGAESVENALRLGAARIGHGIRAVTDRELMKYIAAHKIPLELCPTSNIQTGAVKNFLEEYPLLTFLNEGICATINSDNRTVSDTNLKKEFELVRSLPGIDEEMIAKLTENAFNARFLR